MEKYLNLIKTGSRNELINGSFFVFIGTTFSSFLAFLLNLFLARNLTYADYGVYAVLLSIFSLATVPGQTLNAVVVRFASGFHSEGEISKFSALYKKTSLFLLISSILIVGITILFSQPISHFLKISDQALFVFVTIIICANYFLTLNISFLYSLLKFKTLSNSYSLSGIIKLLAGVALVYLGFRVYGALGAILLLVVVQFFLTLRPLRDTIRIKASGASLPVREIFRYAIPASVAILSLFSFVSTDVVLVKHFFQANEAGYYGGLALVGKVIFYFTLPIPFVMFPLLVKRHTANENYNRILYMAIAIVTIPSLFITGFYYLFPEFTIKIFLGGREYLAIAPYLGIFGIFLTIYSINNIFVNFFLSIKKTNVAFIVFISAIIQVLLIYKFHSGFKEVIYDSIAASLFLLVFMILYYLKENGLIRK